MIDNSRLIKDNPYYFNSADKKNSSLNNNNAPPSGSNTSTTGGDSSSSRGGFASFFRRRSNSNKSLSSIKSQPQSPSCNYVNETQVDQNQFGMVPAQYRGSFRSALRSKSTNSSVTYSQGIIIGECRPNSNVSDSMKMAAGRNRLASYTESTFSYNGSDDVFLPATPPARGREQATTAATTTTSGHRRHSIGTFTNRMRGGSVSDEVPSMPAPKPPVNQPAAFRKGGIGGGRCAITTTGRGGQMMTATASTAMDDILIVTARQSEPAILWANYLKTRFDKITKQRGRVPFNFLHVKLDETNPPADIIQRCLATKLQIVVVCSVLLKMPQAVLMNQLGGILRPDKVLGLLLEVSEEEVQSVHRKCLPCYKQWKRCVVQAQDQSFIGHVLGIATDILGPALRDQPLASSAAAAMMNASTISRQASTEGFTLLPKKVKVGQNKVVAILTEPLARDDIVQVRIDKTGDFVEVANVKRRNPYTLQFSVPDECMEVSMMIDVQVIRNDVVIGCRPLKCESRLRELEQILRSPDAPMEFICQSMGVSVQDSNKLDLVMLQAFQKNIPPGFHLLAPTGGASAQGAGSVVQQRDNSPEEYPTLLHFAARWGLDKLTMQLLECPGGEMAISIRNINSRTPLELAEQYSHGKCVEILRNFSQMHEFTTMYHYFKGVSDSAPNKVIVDLKSEMARKTSTVSQVLSSVPTSPTMLVAPAQKQPEYMEMHCNSSSGGSDKESSYGPMPAVNGVTNLNYINVEDDQEENHLPDDTVDECDGGARDSSFTGPETTNELKINEPAYYESKDSNKTDQFSVDCSNLLDNAVMALPLPPPPPPPSSGGSEGHHNQPSKGGQLEDLMADYLIQPSNRPVLPSNATTSGLTGFGDYLTHPSNKPLYPVTPTNYVNGELLSTSLDGTQEKSHMKFIYGVKKQKSCDDEMNTSCGSSSTGVGAKQFKRQESETSKASVDDELLEIINDFKNNVFTINEVEQLVSTWRNRNDVQQSFRDKEMQLQKMRDEYDRLQTQMKDRMKRPTPFERVRKLFSRNSNKSEEKEGAAEMSLDGKLFNTSGQRPASSLSLHSVTSSSSGRLSTGSVCSGTSLGDSGTHSDHDERRTGASNCRIGTPGSLLMDNYMIPPAPRPVTGLGGLGGGAVEERFRENNPNEHYIIFPSNAPVYPQHDYINFGGAVGLNTIDENKETDIHTIAIQKPKEVVNYATVNSGGRKMNLCSSFRNPSSGGGKGETVQYGRCLGLLQPSTFSQSDDRDEMVMMRNQKQNVKEMQDQKRMFSRQISSDLNEEVGEDHSYMNLTV